MEIKIETVNKILKELSDISIYNFRSYLPKHYSVVLEQKGENWEKEEQREYGEYYYIVKYENYFIKLTCYSDSYGNTVWNKKSIQFVTPVVKSITDYVEI